MKIQHLIITPCETLCGKRLDASNGFYGIDAFFTGLYPEARCPDCERIIINAWYDMTETQLRGFRKLAGK